MSPQTQATRIPILEKPSRRINNLRVPQHSAIWPHYTRTCTGAHYATPLLLLVRAREYQSSRASSGRRLVATRDTDSRLALVRSPFAYADARVARGRSSTAFWPCSVLRVRFCRLDCRLVTRVFWNGQWAQLAAHTGGSYGNKIRE